MFCFFFFFFHDLISKRSKHNLKLEALFNLKRKKKKTQLLNFLLTISVLNKGDSFDSVAKKEK